MSQCFEEACGKPATRRIVTRDGIILSMCDHHAEMWIRKGCTLLLPLHIRLIKHRFATSLVIALICSLITLAVSASISSEIENITIYGSPYVMMETVEITAEELETTYYWLNVAANWLLFFAAWFSATVAVFTAIKSRIRRKWEM